MDDRSRAQNPADELADLRRQLEQERAEHRRAQEELRHFARAVEQSPASIVITDRHGSIEYVNTYFELATGYTRAEAVGKNPRILQSGLMDPDVYREMWSVISQGGEWRGELCNRRKNGDLYWEIAAISGLRDEAGEVSHYVAVKDEITERKAAEERQANLILDLREARRAAEQAAQAKGEFLANMSHEIRTPMNGVIGMTSLLIDTRLSAEQREFTETIRSSAEALLTIINDILDFSKIESGKLELETLDFDLQREVEGVADLLAANAQAKGLELACSLRSGTPTRLRGDAGRLRQILTNLTGNAIKFTAQGEVVVAATVTEESETHARFRFEVRDTGPGISPDVQSRLFQAFSQADASTTRRFGGTGLGLAISRQLVELMGGAIGVTSESGSGSTFWFTLQLEKQPRASQAPIEYGRDLSSLRVLVVDDNATNRQIAGHQLRAWKIFERAAASGAEALDILRDAASEGRPYDVALLDMQMPVMDGMMLARAMQKEPPLAVTKKVVMTSLGHRPSDAELAEAGIDAYMAKPVRQSRLLECLTRVTAGAGRTQATSPAPGPAAIDETPARRIRILLAEDNATNQKVALGQLARLGHSADAVANGIEVLDALERRPYDLVLLDCQMPEMDGYETARAIRRREEAASLSGQPRPRVYIVAMTAHAMEGDRETCLAAGMDDYVSKPVRSADLQAALARWQPAPGPQAPAAEIPPQAATAGGPGDSPVEADPIDMHRLNEMSDHDPVERRALIGMYLDEADELMARLTAAIRSGDAVETERLAHQLGGASATCGMVGIVPPLRELERSGKAKVPAEAAELLQEAARQLTRIRAFLKP